MIKHQAKTVDIHTPEQVSAEVEVLCSDHAEVERLINIGVLRPWCLEDDLRIEAYNRLTEQKLCSKPRVYDPDDGAR